MRPAHEGHASSERVLSVAFVAPDRQCGWTGVLQVGVTEPSGLSDPPPGNPGAASAVALPGHVVSRCSPNVRTDASELQKIYYGF